MNRDELIIACFCMIDDVLPAGVEGKRLRQHGFAPKLSDSEVITMEIVGTYLGYNQDKALFEYFLLHWNHFFPALLEVDRTTFVRQAANLWAVKERMWCLIRDSLLSYDPSTATIDSFPWPVCQFARAPRCSRFKGEAGFGKDHTIRQTFYGFRVHARVAWPGVITHLYLAPANLHEGEPAYDDLTADTVGLLLGDRNYWLPDLKASLRQRGIVLLTPFRTAKHAPPHSWSPVLGRVRYRIETVFGQLVDRCGAKRVWARDLWHLHNRLLRKVLVHTIAVLFNIQEGNEPLQLAQLAA
jgi:hypothetical protein